MTSGSTYAAYRYIKKNRRHKKRHLNRLAFRLLFDKTILIYLAVFGLIFSFWLREQLIFYSFIFEGIENYLWSNYPQVVFLGLIRPLTSAMTRPGVLFGSSDLFLSILPYSQKKLWQYHVLDKIKKSALIFAPIGFIFAIITPFSRSLIFLLIFGFWLVEGLMIIPQWLIYQQRWYIKWLVIQGGIMLIIVLNLFAPFFDQLSILFPLLPISLILINKWGYSRRFNLTDWSKIVDVNDRLLTKNALISFASKVNIDPPKYQGFYHHLIRNKRLRKPFNEQKKYQIYDRLIFTKLIEQKEQLIKFIFGLIFIIVFLGIRSEVTYSWGIIIALFLYAQIGTSFYSVIFEEKLIFALPWQLKNWQQSFSRWLLFGLVPLLISLIIPSFYWFDSIALTCLHFISYLSIGYTLYYDRLSERTKELAEEDVRFPVSFLVSFFVLFFGIIYGIQSPIASILIIIYTLIRYTYNHIVK